MNSYIRINNAYFRNKEFIEFIKTKECSIYLFLLSSVIRDWVYTGKINIFNEFYRKGKLCSRYSQENIADHFGWKQPYVSKLLKNLEERGLIVKHYRRISGTKICVYQFGEYVEGQNNDGKDVKIEYLYMDKIFGGLDGKNTVFSNKCKCLSKELGAEFVNA